MVQIPVTTGSDTHGGESDGVGYREPYGEQRCDNIKQLMVVSVNRDFFLEIFTN